MTPRDVLEPLDPPDTARRGPAVVEADRPLLIMRDDTDHCARELAQGIVADAPHGRASPHAPLARSYRLLQAEVRSELREHSESGRVPEIRLMDQNALARAVRSRAGSGLTVSLDPLLRGDHDLQLSRGYGLGGHETIGLVPRPGSAAVSRQIDVLARSLHGAACVVLEDDVYTGGTITAVVDLMRRAGVTVDRVVPGIHVDTGSRLPPRVVLDPVLSFRDPGGLVDVADPRNFLLGVSGLVVRLPAGQWCRAPYWLPFVHTSHRITIAAGRNRSFALAMIAANLRFYARAEADLGLTIRVRHLSRPVRLLLTALGIVTSVAPVREALRVLQAILAHRPYQPGRDHRLLP
ncbi:hypothetical protein [Actinoplanes awajinensis]|uniref:Phosphoribosyltransferase domain-containing protein n=1 Tax=Actinoplanes awajinensis subsp. mycoplanecinus TaxID=135947 RepID=A0A101JFD5_9ACTN|nr:hypothetical protein [Actinoplanes awajinensis]KUL25801.1 hypothetical protein ADL15_39510 [Actinoplanes awajinensis subsp. mycoplanecinus]